MLQWHVILVKLWVWWWKDYISPQLKTLQSYDPSEKRLYYLWKCIYSSKMRWRQKVGASEAIEISFSVNIGYSQVCKWLRRMVFRDALRCELKVLQISCHLSRKMSCTAVRKLKLTYCNDMPRVGFYTLHPEGHFIRYHSLLSLIWHSLHHQLLTLKRATFFV